jgi:MerR family transcriptional regulator, copper efflux regulator
MNISEVGKRAGLPPKTIRFYEDIGLITPKRMANGYRVFTTADLHRLAFLRRARALGFGIEECRALLALYADPTRASAQVKELARDHLLRVDAQLHELTELRATLNALVASCAGDGRPDCPILADLAQDGAKIRP